MPTSDKPAEQVEGTLPDSASERTKQEFEKLKAHNKELSEKLSQLETSKQPTNVSVLDELRPTAPAVDQLPAPVTETVSNFVDGEGYVDMTAVERKFTQLDEKTRRAEEEARIARERVERFEETEQIRKTHESFPQLDPYNKDTFDPRFYELVKNELIGQMMQGKQDLMGAAKKVSELYSAPTPKADESQEVIAQREQASTVAGASRQTSVPEGFDSLEQGVQKGDSQSIGQMLKANGF